MILRSFLSFASATALCLTAQAQWTRPQSISVSEQYLIAAANQDRLSRGLPPVQADVLLSAAALQHAREMARQGTISHQFPGEPDLPSRASAAGVQFSLVSENVAEASNSALIHDLWMHSEGHRANLLDPHVNVIGIAVIRDHGQLYAVEDFAHTVQHLSFEQQEAAVSGLLAQTGLELIPGAAEARSTCQMRTGYAGARQPWFVMRWTASTLDQLPDELRARLATGKYRQAVIGACPARGRASFAGFSLAVMLYP